MHRTRRLLTLIVPLGVTASLLAPPSAVAASTGRPTSHLRAVASAGTVAVHGTVVVSGSVAPVVRGAKVTLERLEGRSWRVVGHAAESAAGWFSVATRAPGRVGSLTLRVVRPRSSHAAAAVSAALRVRVLRTGFRVTASAPSVVAASNPILVSGKVSPSANGRVTLQRLLAGKWTTMTSQLLTHSRYRFSSLEPAGSYALRVVKPTSGGVAQGTSRTVRVTVQSRTHPVPPAAPGVTILTTGLPDGATHHAYSARLAASGGTAPYTWRLGSGELPAGLVLTSTGTLAGTPTTGGRFGFTVTVTDNNGDEATAVLAITVPVITEGLATWGENGSGNLGDSLPTGGVVPLQVAELGGVRHVAQFGDTDYALTDDGGVFAWGAGNEGQLGNGTTAASAKPVPVTGLDSGVTAVAGGGKAGYALKSDGTVWAWGSDSSGQQGNAASTDNLTPVKIAGLTSVTAIAGEQTAALALKSDGTVWTWGTQWVTSAGDPTSTRSSTPTKVGGLTDQKVVAIAGGGHSAYLLMADHSVRGFGLNEFGELGNRSAGDGSPFFAVPVQRLAHSVTAIAAADNDGYALEADGTVWGWGQNSLGELGGGDTSTVDGAVQLSGLTGVTAIGAASESGYAVMADHTVMAWGDNTYGQLGDNSTAPSATPVSVTGLFNVTEVTGQGLARKADGTIWSWGVDILAFQDRSAARTVPGMTDVVSMEQDTDGGAVVRADGSVWDWGDNSWGELGDGSTTAVTDTPVRVRGLSGVVGLAGGYRTRYAIKSDGTVWTWGAAPTAELGGNEPPPNPLPVPLPGLSDITALAAGEASAYALKADGTVWAWGMNDVDQLGGKTTGVSQGPVQVPGLSDVIAISAGGFSALALKLDGTVWGWGFNFSGQLGNGTFDNSGPSPVVGLSDVTSIATGGWGSYAVRADGSVWSWGFNDFGELGNGTRALEGRAIAAQVPGLSGAVSVAAGRDTGYALLASGTVMAWGWNFEGEVGNGSFGFTDSPSAVTELAGAVAVTGGDRSASALFRFLPL